MFISKWRITLLSAMMVWSLTTVQAQDWEMIYEYRAELEDTEAADSTRIIAANALAYLYHSFDLDSSNYFMSRSFELVKQSDYKKGEADAHAIRAMLYGFAGQYEQALEEEHTALQLREVIGDSSDIAKSFANIGLIYDYKGDYIEALKWYNKGIALRERWGQEEELESAYNNVGVVYYGMGSFDKALEHFQKAKTIAEKIGDETGISNGWNNMGMIFQEKKEYEKALEYYGKSLEMDRRLGNVTSTAYTLSNIGLVLALQEKHMEALDYQLQSLTASEEVGDQWGIGIATQYVGQAYHNLGEGEKAKEYYLRSLTLRQEMGDKTGEINVLNDLAQHHIALEEYREAEDYLNEALEVIKEFSGSQTVKEVYFNLGMLYAAQGKYEKAYEYQGMYMHLKDSLFGADQAKKLTQLEMQYEFDQAQKAREFEYQKAQMEQEARLEKEREYRYYAIAGAGILLILFFFVYRNYRNKKKANELLTQQKVEIESKNEALESANKEITLQKSLIEEKNKDITDSIKYAKRIQDSILPTAAVTQQHLPDHFIYYQPKDIVSGDFYWLKRLNSPGVLFAAADCTGHGVPGALVSVVGVNALNRCVNEFGLTQPAQILDKLTAIVESAFDQSGSEVRDGMDIALCSVSPRDKTAEVYPENAHLMLQYSGANNPLYLVRADGEKGVRMGNTQLIPSVQSTTSLLYEIKGNKQPIGKHTNREPFTNYLIPLVPGDTIYLFSDGYADQFGGEKGKKFKYTNFKQLLLAIQGKPMEEQRQILQREFEQWKGDLEQVDDVCVIGVRV